MQLPGIYVTVRGDYTQLDKDIKAAKAVVTKEAGGISDAINNAIRPDAIKKNINSMVDSFGTLSRGASVAGKTFKTLEVDIGQLKNITGLTDKQFGEFQTRMIKTQAAKAQEDALRKLASQMNLTNSEIKQFGAQFGMTAAQIQNVSGGIGKAHESSFSAATRSVLRLYAAYYVVSNAAQSVAGAMASVYTAGMQQAQLSRAYTEIAGSAQSAKEELSFLRDVSDRLGQNFYGLTDSYKGFLAASKGTTLEGQKTRDIFEAVTKASATLGLSSDRTRGALMAIQQMMSKGKVSAEELRQQLGEQLPGAFNLMAQAVGVSTAKLDDMLKNGEVLADDALPKLAKVLSEKYSGEVDKSVAATNKWAEALQDLKVRVSDGGFMDRMAGSIQSATKELANPELVANVRALADAFATLFDWGIKAASAVAGVAGGISTYSAAFGMASSGVINTSDIGAHSYEDLKKMVETFDALGVVSWDTVNGKINKTTEGFEEYAAAVGAASAATSGAASGTAEVSKKIQELNEKIATDTRKTYSEIDQIGKSKYKAEIIRIQAQAKEYAADGANRVAVQQWVAAETQKAQGEAANVVAEEHAKVLEKADEVVAKMNAEVAALTMSNTEREIANALMSLELAGVQQGTAEWAALEAQIRAAIAAKNEFNGRKAAAEVTKSGDDMVADIKFETEALKMNTVERETAIKMRQLETDAVKKGVTSFKSGDGEYDRINKELGTAISDKDIVEKQVDAKKKADKEMEDAHKHFLENIQDLTADTLNDLFSGKIRNFEDFTDSMTDYFEKGMSEMVANAIMGGEGIMDTMKTAFDGVVDTAKKAFETIKANPYLLIIGAVVGGIYAWSQSNQDDKKDDWAYASGTGTVLGDLAASSESVANSIDILNDVNADSLYNLEGIFTQMKDLNANITGLVSGLVRSVDGSFDASDFGVATGSITEELFSSASSIAISEAFGALSSLALNGFRQLGGAFGNLTEWAVGGTTKTTLQSSGIQTGGISIEDLLGGEDVATQAFARIKSKTSGWFGSSSTKYRTIYQAVDDSISDLFTQVYGNLSETMVEIANSLGTDVAKVVGYSFDRVNLDLTGLTGDALSEKISSWISATGDTAVEAIFGDMLSQYQQLSEGLLETAIRVVSEKEVILAAFDQINIAYSGTTAEAIAMSQALVGMFSDLSDFTEKTSYYYENFFTDGEKYAKNVIYLNEAFASMSMTLPNGVDAFRDIVEAIDITTDAGKEMFVSMMDIAPTFYEMADAIKTVTDMLIDQIQDLYGVTDSSMTASAGNAYIQQALISAQTGGVLPDSSELSAAIDAVKETLVASNYASAFELERDRKRLAGTLTQIAEAFGIEVPAFASGGFHGGGLRVVGEKGWELEATGQSRIWNQGQLADALRSGGDSDLVTEIRALRAELAVTGRASLSHQAKAAQILDKWDEDGMPLERAA